MFEFGIKDFVDIFCVALMLYYIYRLMKESRSLNVFIGIMVFIVVWLFVSQILEMRLLGSIMDKLVSVGVIAIIILFQEEIRKFLYNLGAHRRVNGIIRLFVSGDNKDKVDMESIMPVVMACMNMGKARIGALIVIERISSLDDIVETGDIIDANINQRLIENIFFKNSPLHDGAMVISKKRIRAAGMYPSREPQHRYPEGTRTAPPCCNGHIAGQRCHSHCRVRRDRAHFCGHKGTVPPAFVGRTA